MEFGVNNKGWTVVDGESGGSLCAISVRTAVRAGDRPQVLAVAEEAYEAGTSAAPALSAAISRVDRSLPVLMTLARPRYRLRVMPEPSVPPREMLSSLRWALATESDSDGEDFNLAWMRIPTEEQLPSRPRQVYAVMTPSAWLNSEVALWRQFGVRPKVVDVRETALRNVAGALEHDGEGLALVSADSDGVGMVFTHRGSLYLDRFIEQPLADLRAADAAGRARMHERIAVQLLRSIDVISRSFPFMPVSRVIVAPAPVELGLPEFLAGHLPLRVEPLDLNRIFDMSQVPQLAGTPALQARCLVPLGASLRSAKGVDA